FGAKLVVALMALAAIPAWTLGPGAEPAAAQSSSDAQVQELEAQIKALAAKLEALKAAKSAEAADAQKAQAVEALKRAQETWGEKLKMVQGKVAEVQAQEGGQRAKVITSGEGGYKVIGPDGKELKDVKIIIVDPKAGTSPNVIKVSPPTTLQGSTNLPRTTTGRLQYQWADPKSSGATAIWSAEPNTMNVHRYSTTTTSGSQAVTLSRATYKLNKDQAAALGTLLGSIKATVMETKVDGESITVTTTPEAQQAIGQIVRLIQGQGGTARFEYRLTPTAP